MEDWLHEVRAALDAAPAPVAMFFRDDDAGWSNERLLELLDVFEAFALPVDLAVIPAALAPPLAAELLARPVGLHQHGYAHANHEPVGRKCEFGRSRAPADQRRDIAAGRDRLAALLGDRPDPIFTPPWNRCTRHTAAAVAELGFAALSREARASPFGVGGLTELPVRIDWFAHRNGERLAPAELGARIAGAIPEAATAQPVGLMFHHAIMDAGEMARARELLALLAYHDAVAARPMRELVRPSSCTRNYLLDWPP